MESGLSNAIVAWIFYYQHVVAAPVYNASGTPWCGGYEAV